MEPLYTSAIGIARTLFVLQGLDITVRGERNVPARGGAVIVINHTGYLDFIYAGIPARVHKRFVRYMAKAEVFDHKIGGPLMRGLRHIPVDRTAGSDSYQEAVARLRAGELVGVFPEATISRSFEIKHFKSGAVRMALEAGVPIIPVTMWGSQRIWTKGLPKKLLRPKVPILIEVGAPVQPREPVAECTHDLQVRMQQTLESLQVEYERRFGPHPAGAPWVPARLGGSAPTLEEANRMDEAEHEQRVQRRTEGENKSEAAKGEENASGTVGESGVEGESPGSGKK